MFELIKKCVLPDSVMIFVFFQDYDVNKDICWVRNLYNFCLFNWNFQTSLNLSKLAHTFESEMKLERPRPLRNVGGLLYFESP